MEDICFCASSDFAWEILFARNNFQSSHQWRQQRPNALHMCFVSWAGGGGGLGRFIATDVIFRQGPSTRAANPGVSTFNAFLMCLFVFHDDAVCSGHRVMHNDRGSERCCFAEGLREVAAWHNVLLSGLPTWFSVFFVFGMYGGGHCCGKEFVRMPGVFVRMHAWPAVPSCCCCHWRCC